MYELRSGGWILGEPSDQRLSTSTANTSTHSELNLDEEVNEMLTASSSVQVILGGVILTF